MKLVISYLKGLYNEGLPLGECVSETLEYANALEVLVEIAKLQRCLQIWENDQW